MKTRPLPFNHRRSERGSAVMVIMGMIAIMAICVSVNLAALNTVDRELKLLEKKQVQRLQPKPVKSTAVGSGVNSIATLPHETAKPHD